MSRIHASAFGRLRVAGGALLAGLGLTACGQKPFDATPEGVARELITRMDNVRGEAKDARAVFDLLSRPAQTNLSDRARRASAAAGKRMAPEQMIAPALFYPHFQPQKWATRSQGNRAVVEIHGVEPALERASIPCVLEDGHWRIDLVLPQLPAIERHDRKDRLAARPVGLGAVPRCGAQLSRSRRDPLPSS